MGTWTALVGIAFGASGSPAAEPPPFVLPRSATGERIAACELVEGRGHLLPDLILAAGATIDRNLVIARETGQPLEKVERDTDRNYWMSAEEAVAYGMVSRIITDLKAL